MRYLFSVFFIILIISGCNKETTRNQHNAITKVDTNESNPYKLSKQYEDIGNIEKYVEYLEISAKDGNEIAQNELAGLYAFGEGVPQDGEKFIYWSEVSANNGYSLAQLNLGTAYFFGTNGVTQDLEKAKKWLKLAANNNEDIAQKYLKDIEENKIPDASIPDNIKILMENDK
ncbi:sel1 repeat family protein [Acinetobacter sp. 194]|uniref:tetratricopeptide repeat protein n=1 Tax=Acinetobacter shaoyimingii TaxID=2715164 RepID=UPI00140CAE5B|nr:tetratricopeptide repeat protein [Acinetobacter shaoyimingii]NHB59046.1 sel1 repeat family protein [Acinetobacter shaoyimingii]